jgi:hypothetical protein
MAEPINVNECEKPVDPEGYDADLCNDPMCDVNNEDCSCTDECNCPT